MSNQIVSLPTPHSTAAPSPELSLLPACPLCHTLDDTVTPESLRAGAAWLCTRCGQVWSASRLATAAAYEQYESARASALVPALASA